MGCFNWGAEERVEMVTLRSLECLNWGAEDRVEMVTWKSVECFTGVQKAGWRW